MQWLLFPVAILAGTLMVVQSGCNGMLEKLIERPVLLGIVSLSVGLTGLVMTRLAASWHGIPPSNTLSKSCIAAYPIHEPERARF